jgi:hypothetical protein
MLPKNKTELCDLVYEEIVDCGVECVSKTITDAHGGRPRSFVTNQNLHLFRPYRNTVSPDPSELVKEAMLSKGWHAVVFASDLDPCDGCGEPYCEKCETHYFECECPGPTQDGWEYESFSSGKGHDGNQGAPLLYAKMVD